jgi:hypothetical protein
VRSIYAGWEGGDYTSVEWAHAQIEFVHADGPSPGRWTGHSGLTEGTRAWISAWKGMRAEPIEFRELDDERVLVLTRWRGRGKASQVDLAQMRAEGAGVFYVRDGKVTKLIHYLDRDRALADLGLEE